MENSRVAEVYSEHADTVMRAVWHLPGSRQSAEDCTQEAFLRLMQQDDSMSDAHILPWVMRTAMNLAKDYLKSAEYQRTEPLDAHAEDLFDAESARTERAVFRALKKLPEHYRVPVYLHIVEGYTVLETAKLLGVKFGTAATAVHRGRKLLQKAFIEEEL